MKLNEKDYENIINMIVEGGDVIDEYVKYRKDGETLYFQYTYMVGDGFEIDDASIECLGAGGKAVEHDFDESKVVIDAEKDVAIGEIVEFDGERLVCIEDGSIDGFLEECSGCAFMKNGKCRSIVRSCSKDKRYDGKDVIFKKIS